MNEDEISEKFEKWLTKTGYREIRSKRGKEHGPDIEAISPDGRKLIAEVKRHRLSEYHVDYPTLIGQIIKRMVSPEIDYAVVIEESGADKFIKMYNRFAIEKIGLYVYSVSTNGTVRSIFSPRN